MSTTYTYQDITKDGVTNNYLVMKGLIDWPKISQRVKEDNFGRLDKSVTFLFSSDKDAERAKKEGFPVLDKQFELNGKIYKAIEVYANKNTLCVKDENNNVIKDEEYFEDVARGSEVKLLLRYGKRNNAPGKSWMRMVQLVLTNFVSKSDSTDTANF